MHSTQSAVDVLKRTLRIAREQANQSELDVPDVVVISIDNEQVQLVNRRNFQWKQIRDHIGPMSKEAQSSTLTVKSLATSLNNWLAKRPAGGSGSKNQAVHAKPADETEIKLVSGGPGNDAVVGMNKDDLRRLGEFIFSQAQAGARSGT